MAMVLVLAVASKAPVAAAVMETAAFPEKLRARSPGWAEKPPASAE
jgi:hypothetical protein